MANAMGNIDPDDLAEAFGGRYPKDPVGVGGIWHIASERKVPGSAGKMPMEVEYELTALEDSPAGKIATIKFYSHVKLDLNSTNEGVTVHDVDLNYEGQMRVEVNTGLQLDGSVAITGDVAATSQGKNAKMAMDVKTTYQAAKR